MTVRERVLEALADSDQALSVAQLADRVVAEQTGVRAVLQREVARVVDETAQGSRTRVRYLLAATEDTGRR